MAEVELSIAGRTYRVGCREGEEENLRAAGNLVDNKSREALSGLGSLSEARQLLFASLLIADQLIEKKGPEAVPPPPPPPPQADPMVARRVEAIAERLERLADHLEQAVA